jgi:lysophospholipase L1-like esterase
MKLLTVGDSFTYGDELSDRSLAWPHLLAKKLDYEVVNLGYPGVGNNNIMRTVIEHSDDADIIIIAWSHFARIEVADENGIYDIWPGNAGNLFLGSVAYRHELLTYINKHHNDLYLYSQSLINIILLQNYLNQHNKKYLMLDSFNECYNQHFPRKKLKELTSQLADKIDSKYYLGWPDESMMEWTYGCAQGPGGHFLEDGHRIVADKINEHIRHLGWVS